MLQSKSIKHKLL